MERDSDFPEGQLQVDCNGHRHCNRASFRQLYGNLRTAEQAKRDRERAAQWSAAIIVGLGFVATAITMIVTHQLWMRLEEIVRR